MFDSHVHSKFSEDSNESIENIIKNPKKSGVVITDHMDINVSPRFVFDVDEFYREYIKYRNDYLLLGIEIGLTKETEEEARVISEKAPYDYILGSV
ncbi:MAG: PHP domain-containing protein, partial [Bacillota bacterium]|nr:PHP domain-containing protein [Bacillota bacterium]